MRLTVLMISLVAVTACASSQTEETNPESIAPECDGLWVVEVRNLGGLVVDVRVERLRDEWDALGMVGGFRTRALYVPSPRRPHVHVDLRGSSQCWCSEPGIHETPWCKPVAESERVELTIRCRTLD